MKTTMRKLAAAAAAVAMGAALCVGLTACKRSTANSDKTVITVWSGNNHDKLFITEKVNNWNNTVGKEKNIQISYVVQNGIGDKLTLAFETDQAPDLFSGGNLMEFTEKGYNFPYDDIPGLEGIIEKYGKYGMIGRTQGYDGKNYSLCKSATTYGLIYNKEMFRAAGLVDENGEPTPPQTLSELREYAKKLTNPEKKEYGIIFPGKFSAWYSDDIMKMSSASSGFVDGYNFKTGKFDFSYEGEVMKTILGIKEDGSCYPGVEGLDNDPARARFAEGNIAMKTAASYDFGVLTYQFPSTVEWGVAPFPVIDGMERQKAYMGVGSYMQINAKSVESKSEAIAEVLNFFYSDDVIRDSYKEGIDLPIDWNMVSDIKISDDMKNWTEFAKLTTVSQGMPVALGKDMQSHLGMSTLWLEQIWPGKITVDKLDDFLAAESKFHNEAAERYQKLNPDYDPTPYIIPDRNTAVEGE